MFFNLTSDELFHLFVANYQNPMYSGISLGDNCNPSDFSNNVYEFVSFKEEEKIGDALQIVIRNNKEKKVIKKYKYKTAA